MIAPLSGLVRFFYSPLITRAKRIACERQRATAFERERSERRHPARSAGRRGGYAAEPEAHPAQGRSAASAPAAPEGEGRAARAEAGRGGQAQANTAGSRGSGGANYTTRCILYDCVSRKQPYKMRLSFVYIRAARPQDGGGRPG